MKFKIFLSLLVTCFSLTAVDTQIQKNPPKVSSESYFRSGNFDKLKLSGPFRVELIESDRTGIEMICSEQTFEKITLNFNNQVAHLQFKDVLFFSTGRDLIDVKVYYQKLTEIEDRGPGDIRTQQTLKGDSFRLNKRGTGVIDLELDLNSMSVVLRENADATFKGESSSLTLTAQGSSTVQAADLEVDKAILFLKGSSKMTIHAKETINVHMAGSAQLRYAGQPVVNVKRMGDTTVVEPLEKN